MAITRLEVDLKQVQTPTETIFRPKVKHIDDSGGGSAGTSALARRRRQASDAYKSSKQAGQVRPSVLAKEVMTSPVHSLSFDTSVAEAQDFQAQTDYGHFPIVDASGVLIGLVTDRDLLRGYRLEDDKKSRAVQVGQLMTRAFIAATADTEVRELARVMVQEGFHCVPICNAERKLEGIVTSTDILKALVMHGALSGWI